jgi:hypothetical protein
LSLVGSRRRGQEGLREGRDFQLRFQLVDPY